MNTFEHEKTHHIRASLGDLVETPLLLSLVAIAYWYVIPDTSADELWHVVGLVAAVLTPVMLFIYFRGVYSGRLDLKLDRRGFVLGYYFRKSDRVEWDAVEKFVAGNNKVIIDDNPHNTIFIPAGSIRCRYGHFFQSQRRGGAARLLQTNYQNQRCRTEDAGPIVQTNVVYEQITIVICGSGVH